MTLLGRLAYVGLAKEATQGTWLTPTYYLPCTKLDPPGPLRPAAGPVVPQQ